MNDFFHWRSLKIILVLTNKDRRGNPFMIVTITCCSSLSGLSWIWGMSAMEAASHCSMVLSWGSTVICWGPLPGSLTSEFIMTSAVLGICIWVLSTQRVPVAQRKGIHSWVTSTKAYWFVTGNVEITVLICSEFGSYGFHSTTNTIRNPLLTGGNCSLRHAEGRGRGVHEWALVLLNMGAVK